MANEATKLYRSYANTTGSDTTYDDITAQALREGNYKNYFNRQLQLNNVNALAQKYYRNTVQQSGYGSTGYGSTLAAQQGNAYANLYAENAQNYDNQEMQITQDAYQRYVEGQAASDQNLIGAIQSNPNKYVEIMQQYGYMDADGNFTDAYNNLSDERRQTIGAYLAATTEYGENYSTNNTAINNWMAQINSQSSGAISNALSYEELGAVKPYGQRAKPISAYNADEYAALQAEARRYGNGTLFVLKRGSGNSNNPAYVLFYGGKYYVVSADAARSYSGGKKIVIQGNKAITEWNGK